MLCLLILDICSGTYSFLKSTLNDRFLRNLSWHFYLLPEFLARNLLCCWRCLSICGCTVLILGVFYMPQLDDHGFYTECPVCCCGRSICYRTVLLLGLSYISLCFMMVLLIILVLPLNYIFPWFHH